jgi:hypothetical protein
MSNYPNDYFKFSGCSLGVSAVFTELDGQTGLNHVIPSLAPAVLGSTGGRAQGSETDYAYIVEQPRKRTLLSVRKADTVTHGRTSDTKYETEVEADIEELSVVDKLNIGSVHLHFLSTFDPKDQKSKVSTKGSRIEGVQLGKVTAEVILDEEPLLFSGNGDQLVEFYNKQSDDYRQKNGWRFKLAPDGKCCREHKFSIVREIKLSGPEPEKQKITVDGYTIHWKSFGKIVLGEVHVKCNERRVTLVRLAMGCDAGGNGTAGGGASNGGLGN